MTFDRTHYKTKCLACCQSHTIRLEPHNQRVSNREDSSEWRLSIPQYFSSQASLLAS